MSYDLKLREIRKAVGISQRDAAAMVGVTPSGWNGWELGKRQMSLADACAVCDVLGCTLDELAGRAAPSMTAEEREVMEALRATNGQGREAIVAVARSMKSAPSAPSAREVREAV